ncbi:MAG: PepSY-like domain-containing protein [Bacteroidales bacterium]|jgi:outer membrane lipoprotein-sorting protein|nr:PepSY-like domain-containing protein [Bacteroidales bacterium]MDD2204891.1 PepSY-like domain-containing protein [Bacteroidales bacterium]MDD3151544.1 PepSY-like domain-containing protein [Bacteroidales bacterium]MDD3913547.1 PepSY-like domain-containing protein [Bacteroidales bacterium]MDD4634142.1 PepSY-like domain-containing protein [Bacteroidales bacterium]
MKNLLIILTLISAITLNSCAQQETMIDSWNLPTAAQEFISTHFSSYEISFVMKDKELFETTYEVILNNGDKIDFNKSGEWEDIDCPYSKVPTVIIPEKILTFVQSKYPDYYIISIGKDKKHYEIELNNDLDLKFDLNYNLIEID